MTLDFKGFFRNKNHQQRKINDLWRLESRRWVNWTFTAITFNSKTPLPTGVSATATYPNAGVPQSFSYVVTAINGIGYEESEESSASNSVDNDLTITGNYNTISWNAVSGAVRYNVFKYAGGTYAYIGQTTAVSFEDKNILADLTQTIPLIDPTFNGAGNYPSSVGYYEQRRFFAGTNNQPMNMWGPNPALITT
jgi:hypothetical protein